MLNPFPIQFLALFAYFLLRICVAGILFYLGITHLKHKEELKHILALPWFPFGNFAVIGFALFELTAGAFILVGAHTQYTVLLVFILCLKMILVRQWFDHPSIPSKLFYVLLLGVSACLFITGAGAFAFDLPI